jgi:hypothetical protein
MKNMNLEDNLKIQKNIISSLTESKKTK